MDTNKEVPSQDAEKQREEEKQKEKSKRQQINQDIQNNLINSTKELFSNVEKYLQGEITGMRSFSFLFSFLIAFANLLSFIISNNLISERRYYPLKHFTTKNHASTNLTRYPATSEDYKLLETMNNMTKEKYVDMTNTAHGLVEYMTLLQQKCKSICSSFQP